MTEHEISDGPQLFYRLGLTREQGLFRELRETYYGIALRANYLAYFQKFVLTLLVELKKPFFIDPVTYIFARHPSKVLNKNDNPKLSFVKLASAYGSPIEEKLAVSSVELSDFSESSIKSEFVEKVVSFQTTRSLTLPKKYSRYQRFIDSGAVEPLYVLPPYFYIEDIDAGWYDLNIELARLSANLIDKPIYPVIFISHQLVQDMDVLHRITNDYDRDEFDGYFIWIDDLSGVYKNTKSVRGYKDFVEALASLGKPIYSLYGDYFSALLWYEGLSGYCSGICYGERMQVDPAPVGGAIPDRYYIPPLKLKYSLEGRLERIRLSNYPDLKCDCGICPASMIIEDFSTEECQKHFMTVRAEEIREISTVPKVDVLRNIQTTFDRYSDMPLFDVTHLEKWIDILG